MKRHFLLSWLVAAAALSAATASAQDSLLPAQELVPVPASTANVSADNYLNPLHQEEWVVLNSESGVTGKYVQLNADGTSQPVGSVTLYLTRNSAPIATVTTDAEGRFALTEVVHGTYGLVARSERSLAAFALHVLPAGASNKLDSDFTVYGTTTNGATYNDVLRAHTVPGGSAIYPDFHTDPVGDARQFSDQSKVQLRANGLLVGRVSKPEGFGGTNLTGNVVHILRNGIVVGHQPTNARGEFEVPNLNPGVYDLIVAGKDGIAAGSFQAVAASGVAKADRSAKTRLVSTQEQEVSTQTSNVADSLNVELIPTSDYYVGEVEVVDPPIFEDPGIPLPGGGFAGPGGFPGGGFGGGGGGFGGGGGGGFGGLGGLLGIGGLAAGVAALAANDDGFNLPPASIILP